MASGFSYSGGRSRCFTFWQEFQKCYANADAPQECVLQKEDYLECLHRTKEIARAKEIKAHFLRQQAKDSHDSRQAAERAANGVIVSLGLIDEGDGGEGK